MTDTSDASCIMDVFARETLIIQKASYVSAQWRPRLNAQIERPRTNAHTGDMKRRNWRVLHVLISMNAIRPPAISRLTFIIYLINPCFMRICTPQPAAVPPIGARRPLLFGSALPRRRSLLLPERGQRGRSRHVQAREAAVASFLASLPAGSAVTAREMLSRVPGLRLAPGQEQAVKDALRAAGWRSAGRGCEVWTRPGDAPAQRRSQASRWHPAVAKRMDRIAAFLSGRNAVTAEEVAHAVGIALPGQRQRCVARALARLGFAPPGRGGRVWTRDAAP